MRLIDADALKKDIEENAIVLGGVQSIEVECAKVLIDNTPTVNDCPNCEYKLEADYIRSSSSYKELIDLRKFKEENTRPQGEWGEVFHYQGWNYHKCSNCHLSLKLSDYDNFCSNCGADMRKGGAE